MKIFTKGEALALDEFSDFLASRRSTRDFLPDPVS